MSVDRGALAHFLRRSRERLQPADVGLVAGPRRRTPGLRRDDVAALAGISADYYTRLEQARGPQPSESVLRSLARALRLDDDERDHLYHLCGERAPRPSGATRHVRPGLLHLLNALEGASAAVLDDLGDTLAQNELSRRVFGEPSRTTGLARHTAYRWFTDPGSRHMYLPEDQPGHSRILVAQLRGTHARRRGDGDVEALVAGLVEASPEFVELWERHEVAVRRQETKRLLHKEVGVIEVDCEVLTTPHENQQLILLTPRAGTGARDKLELLRVIGAQRLEPALTPSVPAPAAGPSAGRSLPDSVSRSTSP